MAKKYKKLTAGDFGKKENETPVSTENHFYFGAQNYKLMLIGLALIVIGFVLMMGPDANTVDGKYDVNVWNDGIFSIRRIRIAPLFVIAGFVVEVYAILKRNKV